MPRSPARRITPSAAVLPGPAARRSATLSGHAGFRQIRDEDFPAVTALLNEYLSGYKLRQAFDEAEVRHFLTPQEGLVYAYVVEADDGALTDVCSFYCLPSSILNHPQHSELRAAYMCAPPDTRAARVRARGHCAKHMRSASCIVTHSAAMCAVGCCRQAHRQHRATRITV